MSFVSDDDDDGVFLEQLRQLLGMTRQKFALWRRNKCLTCKTARVTEAVRFQPKGPWNCRACEAARVHTNHPGAAERTWKDVEVLYRAQYQTTLNELNDQTNHLLSKLRNDAHFDLSTPPVDLNDPEVQAMVAGAMRSHATAFEALNDEVVSPADRTVYNATTNAQDDFKTFRNLVTQLMN